MGKRIYFEFYVVAWCTRSEYGNGEDETEGIFDEVFFTRTDAKVRILRSVEEDAEKELELYGYDDLVRKYGTSDIREVARYMVMSSGEDRVVQHCRLEDTTTVYTIREFKLSVGAFDE